MDLSEQQHSLHLSPNLIAHNAKKSGIWRIVLQHGNCNSSMHAMYQYWIDTFAAEKHIADAWAKHPALQCDSCGCSKLARIIGLPYLASSVMALLGSMICWAA